MEELKKTQERRKGSKIRGDENGKRRKKNDDVVQALNCTERITEGLLPKDALPSANPI
jgi:hypothetical protein